MLKIETHSLADFNFQLLHQLVDSICHRARPTYEEFSKIWSLQEWWTLTDTFTDLFKEAVKNTWTKDQVNIPGLITERIFVCFNKILVLFHL